MAKSAKTQAARSSYDRKARKALMALGEFVQSLPPSIMLRNVCLKRDVLLAAIEEIKPKARKR